MGLIVKGRNFFHGIKKKNIEKSRNELLDYLFKLRELEAKLWGISLVQLSSGEEKVLENANHLIHFISHHKHDEIKKVLKLKDYKDFLKEIEALREDFLYFKKQVKERDVLRNLITKFTIKQVDHKNFHKLENVFILEKQLYEVLDKQEEEFKSFFNDFSKVKIDGKIDKVEHFLDALKKIRKILSGHMDFHDLWESEREGFSNSSNIIHSLIKVVKVSLEE